MEMSVRYKISNETWSRSGVYGCQWVYLLQFTVCDNTVPLQQYLCSCRALAEQPLQIHPCLPHCDAEMQPKQGQRCCLESRDGLKARVFYAQALPSVQCLSDCLASLDNQWLSDAPFAGWAIFYVKGWWLGYMCLSLRVKFFLSKFRLWLYRCLF